MGRLQIKASTLKALFAKSGNVCAFTDCSHELVTPDNIFVGHTCHIEAASKEGARYNPNSDDEYRRSFENLLLLCYKHHRIIDERAEQYSVDSLREIKQKHEDVYSDLQSQYTVSNKVIQDVQHEMDKYWKTIKGEHETKHVIPELAVKLPNPKPGGAQFSEIYKKMERVEYLFNYFNELSRSLNDEIREHLKNLGYDLSQYDTIKYYDNPFINRAWEMHNLGANNALIDLYNAIKQTEIIYLSEFIKLNSNDRKARRALNKAKKRFRDIAIRGGYAD